METHTHPPFRPFLIASIILLLLGIGFFLLAVFSWEPTIWPKWLFFFGGSLALTGLALPAAWFLNLRFPSDPPAWTNVILRQAAWVGVFGGIYAWLQQERLASLGILTGLALGLAVIEYLIRMRERSLWHPPVVPEVDPQPGPAQVPPQEPPPDDQPA